MLSRSDRPNRDEASLMQRTRIERRETPPPPAPAGLAIRSLKVLMDAMVGPWSTPPWPGSWSRVPGRAWYMTVVRVQAADAPLFSLAYDTRWKDPVYTRWVARRSHSGTKSSPMSGVCVGGGSEKGSQCALNGTRVPHDGRG